jgi:hypothetical protein
MISRGSNAALDECKVCEGVFVGFRKFWRPDCVVYVRVDRRRENASVGQCRERVRARWGESFEVQTLEGQEVKLIVILIPGFLTTSIY